MPEPAALLTAAVLAALDSTSANASFQRYPDPSSTEQCQRRAQFASLSRTLACLVNEHLVEAVAVECGGRYFGVASSEHADRSVGSSTSSLRDCAAESIIFELLYRPLSTPATATVAAAAAAAAAASSGSDAISWIDPSELTHKIVCVSNDHRVVPITSSAELISIFGRWTGIESALIESICDEYANSDRNMAFAYANSPLSKTPALRDSPPIEWEQSLLEGHPTYPIHKNRYAVPPMPPQPASLEMELYSPTIRFAAVPKSDVIVGGDYRSIIRELFAAFFDDAHQHLLDDDSVAIVPVHSVHLPVVKALFPDVQLLPESCSAAALGMSSMRSVILKSGSSRYSIKFPISIRISSGLRTLSCRTAKNLNWINDVLDVLVDTALHHGGSLLATREYAYAVSADPELDRFKHFACMIRDSSEYYASLTGDAVVVCAALVEEQHPVHAIAAGADPNGPRLPLLYHIWREQLATADGKLAFLRDYTRKYLLAVLPSLLVHGFAFEAHGQIFKVCY